MGAGVGRLGTGAGEGVSVSVGWGTDIVIIGGGVGLTGKCIIYIILGRSQV